MTNFSAARCCATGTGLMGEPLPSPLRSRFTNEPPSHDAMMFTASVCVLSVIWYPRALCPDCGSLRTRWQPEAGDEEPVLTTALPPAATVRAIRIAWRDVGLNTTKGINPGPFRYRVEAQGANNQWTTLIDRSASTEDLLIDYRECPPTTAGNVRLVIVGAPQGITPGVEEFTVFGEVPRRPGN